MTSSFVTQPTENLSTNRGLLDGKVAVITGGGNGIGRAMALSFASQGARVVIADLDQVGANKVTAEIEAAGGSALAVDVDIVNSLQVEAMWQKTLNWGGRVDVLVNNAAIGHNQPFLSISLQDWNRLLEVVLTGTFICAQQGARIMAQQKAGSIINIASISGQRGAQGRAAYGVAKAGVIQLTLAMAVELAELGIRVNAISPGPVDTLQSRAAHTQATREAYLSRIPLARYGTCEEIAAAALFLASDQSSFVHGHVLNVDGGYQATGLVFDPDAE